MRAVFTTVFACLLALTLVVRATPRACGSTFACCGEAAVTTAPASQPSCCEDEQKPKPPTHAVDEPMACCMPLTMPATVDALDVATHALVGNSATPVERSTITHTLEPATPPPRAIA